MLSAGNPQSLILIPFFPGSLTSDDVVEAVLRGFKRGEEDYGVVARVLLCCIRFSELKHLLDKGFHTIASQIIYYKTDNIASC